MKVVIDKDNISYASNGILNNPGFESTASFSYKVEVSKDINQTHRDYIYQNAEFSISDCTRVINLSFEAETPEQFENSINKVDKLINAFKEFKKEMIASRIHYNKLSKELEKLKKEDEENKS